MKFTENQKQIFDQIRYSNGPLSLYSLMVKHFQNKNLIVTINGQYLNINIGPDVNIYNEFKDLLYVLIYVQDHRLVYVRQFTRGSYQIRTTQNITKAEAGYDDLTNLLGPFWSTQVSSNFTLHEFINDGYRTKEDLKVEEERIARDKDRELNETRLREERQAREKEEKARKGSQKLTIGVSLGAVLLSAIMQWVTANKERDVYIRNATSFPDTVKVMNFNPPKDTGFTK